MTRSRSSTASDAGVPPLQATRRCARCGPDGTWLAADQLDFHGASAVASGWLRRAHRLLDPLEPGPDHGWLAFHEGYLAYGRGEPPEAREQAARPRTLAAGSPFPTSRCSASRWRALRSSRAPRSRTACAVSTKRPSRRSRARRRSRSPAPGPAASWSARAPPCSTTSGRVSGATGSPSSPSATEAGTCSPSAEPSTAPCTSRAAAGRKPRRLLEASLEDFAPSRPAWVGGPLVGLAELRRRPGPSRGRGATARSSGRLDRGSAVPRSAGARPGRAPAGSRARRAPAAPPARVDRRLDRAPALELLVRARRRARRARRGPVAARAACARSSSLSARASLGRTPIWPRGCLRPRSATTSRPGRSSRTPSTASSAAGRRSTPRAARLELADQPPRSDATDAAEREARRRARRPARARRGPRGGAGAAVLSALAADGSAVACPSSPRASATCCACSRRGSRTGRSPSGSSSASTPCTATSPTSCGSSTFPRVPPRPPTPCALGLLDSPGDSQIWPSRPR